MADCPGHDPGNRLMLILVLAAAAILGLACAVIIPPWQLPDEPTHLEYARVLARGVSPWAPRPDLAAQGEIISSLDRYDYWRYVGVERPSPLPVTFRETPFLAAAPSQIGKNPPLYYFLASLVLRLSPARSLEAELYRLRLLSLFFTLLTIALVGACAGEVFGRSSPLVPAAAAAVAFLPQFLVIGVSASPDPAINFCGAAVIYLVLRFQKAGFTPFRILMLLLCLGLSLLINYKALILLAALPGVAIIRFVSPGRRFPAPGKLAAGAGLLLLILSGAYSVLVWYSPEVARIFIVRIGLLCSIVGSFIRGRTYFPPGYWSWFNSELFKSFWLKYGWLQFELPAAAYRILAMATVIALTGTGLFLARWLWKRKIPRGWGGEAIVTLLFLAGTALASYYIFWGLKGSVTTTQGRHFFLMSPAWGVLFPLGWSSLFPVRWERPVGYGLVTVFFLFAAASIGFSILPTFS